MEGTPPSRSDRVTSFASGFDGMPGVTASQRRVAKHGHEVFPAFNSLGIFDRGTAADYLKRQLDAVKLPDDQRDRLMVIVLNFGMVCVEADRERREDST